MVGSKRGSGAGRKQTDPDGSPSSGKSFDERLREARNKHGLDPQPVSDDAVSNASALSLVARVGVELVAAVLLGAAIGWGLDAWLRTRPLFLIVFVLLGGAAGIVNVWRLVGRPPG